MATRKLRVNASVLDIKVASTPDKSAVSLAVIGIKEGYVMKKLFVVLLAILVLGSVAMIAVACGGEEETTTTEVMEETTVTEASTDSDVLTPAEAAAKGQVIVDQFIADGDETDNPEKIASYSAGTWTVAGPVLSISPKSDKYIVVLGDDTNKFSLSIMMTDMEALGYTEEALNAMVGTNLEATGEIVLNPFGHGAEIRITDPSQIVLL